MSKKIVRWWIVHAVITLSLGIVSLVLLEGEAYKEAWEVIKEITSLAGKPWLIAATAFIVLFLLLIEIVEVFKCIKAMSLTKKCLEYFEEDEKVYKVMVKQRRRLIVILLSIFVFLIPAVFALPFIVAVIVWIGKLLFWKDLSKLRFAYEDTV